MKTLFTVLILLPVICFAQPKEAKLILVTLKDSTNIYDRIKIALVTNDFIVKEDGNKDTLTTYSKEIKTIPGYSILTASINGSTVRLSGVYGLKRMNDWGYTTGPKKYKQIIYYKGSKTWKLLMQVAESIGGTITYAK